MATKNRRVAAYIPPRLESLFQAFMEENGITSESQALIAILDDFFGFGEGTKARTSVEQAIAEAIESNPAMQRLGELVERVEKLEQELKSKDKPEGMSEFFSRTYAKYYGGKSNA